MSDTTLSAPFSKSADKNKDVIFEQLRACLKDRDRLLEIASGTGQHALHITEQWPALYWQTSDVDISGYGLDQALATVERANLPDPITINIEDWPDLQPDYHAVFSANCVHIAGMAVVNHYFEGAAKSLLPGGQVLLYGPFKFNGAFTAPSNADFDAFLKAQYPDSGIRDFEALDELAKKAGLEFQSRIDVPSNNQFLIWRK